MLSLLRSGGTIALEDVDNVSWLCQPAHPSWDILLNAFHTVFQTGGGDPFIGRRLPVLLHAADSVRDKIVAKGILDDAKLTDHREALAQHLKDPATIVIDKLLVQCWGQKPR